MKVLVTVDTKHGSTAEIGTVIARVLGEHGHDAVVVHPRYVSTLDSYDAVVLGSPVYAGRWMDAARTVVDHLQHDLAARPVWLFSSGLAGVPGEPGSHQADMHDAVAKIGAKEHRFFTGKLDRDTLGITERAIVGVMHATDGDFRDWSAVTAWAESIADALDAPGALDGGAAVPRPRAQGEAPADARPTGARG